MNFINPTLLDNLRDSYRQTASPADVLKEIVRSWPTEPCHKLVLIAHMRAAFELTLQQAGPIAGWAVDGTGELKDAQIDSFLKPEIEHNRDLWDRRTVEANS